MKQILLVIGIPGSGKDTQIEYMVKRRQLNVIRVGDLIRKKAKFDKKIQLDFEAGNLVDNKIVNELVADTIQSASPQDYIVSNGFPRDLTQAVWLDKYLAINNYSIDRILLIDVSDAVATERLLKRGRDDDNRSAVVRRLKVFHTQTDDVIEYYQRSGKLTKIDGSPSPEEVAKDIQEVLNW